MFKDAKVINSMPHYQYGLFATRSYNLYVDYSSKQEIYLAVYIFLFPSVEYLSSCTARLHDIKLDITYGLLCFYENIFDVMEYSGKDCAVLHIRIIYLLINFMYT